MNTNWLKKVALATVMVAMMTQEIFAAGLNASINAGTVAIDDQFQLTLSTQDPHAQSPDLNPLYTDFNILGTSQSMQTQYINGQQSSEHSWIITLSPKRKGKLIIPAISAGSNSSKMSSINVVADSHATKSIGHQKISITASVKKSTNYIYQEIPLKVRIETALPLQQATLLPPQGNGFELSQVGEDKSSQIEKHGQLVNIIERDYLIRPQKSGPISIPAFVLQGEIPDNSSRNNPFGDFPFGSSMMRDFGMSSIFNQGKPFKVRSNPVSLTIKANPNTAKGGWFLPAKNVKINAQWESSHPVFHVGEAVTRKITLQALGAQPEQLPKLDIGLSVGAKMYLDDSVTNATSTPDGTLASRIVQVSVVPTQGGKITLPEIKVNWLDTTTNKQRVATLPAKTIHVIGAPLVTASSTPSNAVNQQPTIPASKMTSPQDYSSDLVSPLTSENLTRLFKNNIQLWIGLLVTLVLIFGLYLFKRHSKAESAGNTSTKTASNVSKKPAVDKEENDLNTLINTLKAGNENLIYRELLKWKRSRTNNLFENEINGEIKKLEDCLFANKNEQSSFDPQPLGKILNSIRKETNKQSAKQKKGLQPLYPANA